MFAVSKLPVSNTISQQYLFVHDGNVRPASVYTLVCMYLKCVAFVTFCWAAEPALQCTHWLQHVLLIS